MSLYGSPDLSDWFQVEYTKTTGRKPDMGKNCIRFRKIELISFQVMENWRQN